MSTSATADIWVAIAALATGESSLWAESLRPEREREREPVFSPLGEDRFALAVETIYEGYLLHYGRPRLFAPPDRDTAILLGDYLYAQGLVHLAATGSVGAVGRMAELISLCAHLRGSALDGDGEAWAEAVADLDGATSRPADDAVDAALAAHAARVE